METNKHLNLNISPRQAAGLPYITNNRGQNSYKQPKRLEANTIDAKTVKIVLKKLFLTIFALKNSNTVKK